jgi:hypothetical protein
MVITPFQFRLYALNRNQFELSFACVARVEAHPKHLREASNQEHAATHYYPTTKWIVSELDRGTLSPGKASRLSPHFSRDSQIMTKNLWQE